MANQLPPAPISTTDLNSYQWKDWFRKLHTYITGVSGLLWSSIDFTSSTITDIADRQHNDLQVLQGGIANQYYHITSTDYIGNGTGTLVRTTSPSLTTPILGTPTSGSLVNCTNFPVASLTGLAPGLPAFLATATSFNLKSAVTDDTGSGALVFATSPTLVTPFLGTPTSGNLINCTGYEVTNLASIDPAAATWLTEPSGNSIVSGTVKVANAAGFISSDGSTGYTGTVTTASLVGKTITIKDGIITGFA